MKRFVPILALATVLTAAAGTFYDKSIFYGDVSLGTWTAPTNFTAAVSYGGAYTNGTSFWYRIAGTNAAGLTPWATNSITIAGGAASNAIALSWTRRDGITGYLLQRSPNGTTWTQHITRGVAGTSYDDVHDTNWTAGAGSPTGSIASASVPWAGASHPHSLSSITNAGTAAMYDIGVGSNMIPCFLPSVVDPLVSSFAIVNPAYQQLDLYTPADVIENNLLGSAATNATSDFAAAFGGQMVQISTNPASWIRSDGTNLWFYGSTATNQLSTN